RDRFLRARGVRSGWRGRGGCARRVESRGAGGSRSDGRARTRGAGCMRTRDIDDLLLHIRGLVLVREILRQRGASPAELDAHTAELARLEDQLTELTVPIAS